MRKRRNRPCWEDETFIELDNATDIEFFDDLSAEEMCALGNASDANNSLADAFDADLFAEFCADTELADLIDSAMYEARVGRRRLIRVVRVYRILSARLEALLTCARGLSHVVALHGR